MVAQTGGKGRRFLGKKSRAWKTFQKELKRPTRKNGQAKKKGKIDD